MHHKHSFLATFSTFTTFYEIFRNFYNIFGKFNNVLTALIIFLTIQMNFPKSFAISITKNNSHINIFHIVFIKRNNFLMHDCKALEIILGESSLLGNSKKSSIFKHQNLSLSFQTFSVEQIF